ncbi:MAG: sodium:proton antiporter NhaD [gamma proteobacterium symbiont of Bathyaustriella thionipta]|nr:sodium:proton antiporter NhaD [gamma proteobacterium symbiont of Bathyaustriella thionipta]MCU7949011.1 sodium:proton antiporter NhaD [gamma proteobacterium symbiont of Bathyaustriella thionipta]MCU7952211.1 sodium:proton antiporter NhaD [gamma proteobacterium symbiont of Bathyaustriella thionipta]MCU7955595.1 sodium:proton antiporter NhaD [gamma proteobacterium symbiont of Bathyaustriella thionipta]MCU7968945.1 sodium:proton antiporter NhaD [gamma proteobacterium symbiont of Bathyaustriella
MTCLKKIKISFLITLLLIPLQLFAADAGGGHEPMDLTSSPIGYFALILFMIAYFFVMAEEFTHLRKSKPVIFAAGVIWAMIGWVYIDHGMSELVEHAVRHNLLEYAELMLFLLVAMTYINGMEERRVFDALRSWLIRKGFSFRQLFWMTGILAFFISPIADNLTTALLMCAVVLAVGGTNSRFVTLACINIVVGANAGGAFSPFGDITTLMVWQKGMVDFWGFFALFIPSVINFVVPAAIMHFAIPNEMPNASDEVVTMKRGAKRMIALFLLTITTAVSFHNFLGLPPVIGMLTGLSYLQFLGYYLKKTKHKCIDYKQKRLDEQSNETPVGEFVPFDVFVPVARAEWDTLFFFYGVVLCVGGLGFLGYLSMASELMYTQWGATTANIAVGILSAIVDNIPVMFAVLTMNPEMSQGQWLLVTMTAGVGGSLLSIGSAAGVALMGQARGQYTFFGHLKWAPAIAVGYIASIGTHMWINSALF